MNFNRINNIVGWCICLIACMVYILTAEAGGSLWDCGEFVSSCFKVQIPHPPGAPLFILMGRIFIVLFGDNPLTAAKAVNTMSALASGFTILFLFWTIPLCPSHRTNCWQSPQQRTNLYHHGRWRGGFTGLYLQRLVLV
jgi:hypothetical protein